MNNNEVIKKAEQDLSLAGEMGYKTRIQKLEEENKELLDALCDAINQACRQEDGTIDSFALSAYAYGMHVLEEHGRLKIKKEAFRRVIGEWVVTETVGK